MFKPFEPLNESQKAMIVAMFQMSWRSKFDRDAISHLDFSTPDISDEWEKLLTE